MTLVSRDADVITLPADRSGKPGVRVDWACECVSYRCWEGRERGGGLEQELCKKGLKCCAASSSCASFAPRVEPNAPRTLSQSTQRHTQSVAGTPAELWARQTDELRRPGQSRR